MIRNLSIAGATAVLAVAGGVWTNQRETNSPCGDAFYVGIVQDEMRAELLAESAYLAALDEGAENEEVSAENQAIYRDAAAKLRTVINEAEIVGRMKHPNNSDLKNCHLQMRFSDALAEFDLGQRSTLGFPVDRTFEVVARFEIRFEDITGAELASRIERQRDQWLIGDIEQGELVETARIAKLTRRAFDIKEPEFVQINYDTSFMAEEPIEGGFFGEL